MLISGGNLIKKVLFPAEVLPIVAVLSNMVHFLFGLPIVAIFLIYFRAQVALTDLAWFPVIVLVQLVLTTGFALALSALTVHFRDIKDILSNLLTFWFFSTPIIYPMTDAPWDGADLPEAEPVHAPRGLVPGGAVLPEAVRAPPGPAAARRGLRRSCSSLGYFLFDRLRDSFAEEV